MMSNEDYGNIQEEGEIMRLPEEILREIFIYVDDATRKNVALVCHTFYELICGLEKDKFPLDLSYSQIYDDDLYNSLIMSERQFCHLTIDLKGCRILSSIARIETIVEKFGHRIKKLKFCSSMQRLRSNCEVSESQLVKILEKTPNIEEFVLYNVHVSSNKTTKLSSELDLHKLRKLILDYCSFDTPLVLDSIPANVIQKLVFTFDSPNEKCFQNFFNRQTKIKTLEIFENGEISFDHLELEHLKISSSIDFVSMLSQQPKLRYIDFAITWVDDAVFAALCSFKYLEVLRTLIDQVSIREFRRLKELTRLRELRLDSHDSFDCGHLLELARMKVMQLEKLTLVFTERKIPVDIVIQISRNFLKIKYIEFINRSINIVSTVIENFPNIESIILDFFAILCAAEDLLEINNSLRHENLKQLVVTNVPTNDSHNTPGLLKLANACPNLEKLMLSQLTNVSMESFKELMDNHPKLTHLSLEFNNFGFDLDIVKIIKNLSKNLVHLRLIGLSNYPSYIILKSTLEEQFPNIRFYKNKNGGGTIVMKKRRSEDWYSNFNLRDHF